jgi:aerobic-type carbon monoxide dehydrogenase small subunit (CoxS/CutS family)
LKLLGMYLTINDSVLKLDDRRAKAPLLWVLRDVLEMHGTKFGCGVGYCAA